MKFGRFLGCLAAFSMLCACNGLLNVPGGSSGEGSDNGSGGDASGDNGSGGASQADPAYVFDMEALPEITLYFPLDQWNDLLAKFDANPSTKEYVHCNVTYRKGKDVFQIDDAAVRLRGNTSRRRPEAGSGEHIGGGKADWSHCHFGLNLRKFVKDDKHEIKGIRKLNLKWFNNDPSYVREVFCYDLFRRAGVWSASEVCYARLWVHVEGDPAPAYYGVYAMIEPYDNKFIERRADKFGDAKGNLWKCTYNSQGPADLRNPNASMGMDDGVNEYTYELKETSVDFATAKAQLQTFIRKLNAGKDGDEFVSWFSQVCDVPLLVRTYAVNVALGMWDDHWNNGNNYYLYFNSTDNEKYQLFFLPYDYDNTLGTGNGYDPAKQNPTQWGSMGKLMQRIIKAPQYKALYIEELKRVVKAGNGLMDPETAKARVRDMQNFIAPYVDNDTGDDVEIRDEPAPWGSYGHYRLISDQNNYFTEKARVINSL